MLDRPEPRKPKVCARRLRTFLSRPLSFASSDRFPCSVKRAVSPSRPSLHSGSRAAAVKAGRRPPPEAARRAPARSGIDRREHGPTLTQSGQQVSLPSAACGSSRGQRWRPSAALPASGGGLPRRWCAAGHRGSTRPGWPLRHYGVRGLVALRLRHWFALGKSGQLRPYVRPARRGYSAGHHGCALACQAPFCRACSWHETAIGIAWAVLTTAFPITLFSACCRTGRALARPLPAASARHATAAAGARPFAW